MRTVMGCPPDRLEALAELIAALNRGESVESVFDVVYERARAWIPYHRLGVARLDDSGTRLTLAMVRSDGPLVLRVGYCAPLAGSTLEPLIRSGTTRVIGDLAEYLRRKPGSTSTRLIVQEGMRSSLTVPLIAEGRPVGVMFFSSRERNLYCAEHEMAARLIAGHVAVAFERAELIARLRSRTAELERALEELRRRQEELAEARGLAAIGELAAAVAHEVKNPLAGINAAVEVLASGMPPEDPRRAVIAEIHRQVRRLDDTVRDLLLYARPWKPSPLPVDFTVLARQVVEAQRRAHAAAPVALEVERRGDPVAEADAQQMEHVLVNLVQNAIEAMPCGGTARVCVLGSDGSVRVEVSDTGGGIPPEIRPRLFQAFVSSKPRGTGLGLAICKRIVEAHGGRIGYSSEPGRGTTVWFEVPRRFSGGAP